MEISKKVSPSGIASPGVTAFGATEELGGALVDAPGLDHPPEGGGVVTFRAWHLGLGEDAQLPLLLPDYDDLILHLVVSGDDSLTLHLLLGPALWADVHLLLRI